MVIFINKQGFLESLRPSSRMLGCRHDAEVGAADSPTLRCFVGDR
jgi:hypothetical protein